MSEAKKKRTRPERPSRSLSLKGKQPLRAKVSPSDDAAAADRASACGAGAVGEGNPDGLDLRDVRFRKLFNHMASGAVVYEAVDDGGDFIIRDFNPAAEKIEKVRREDVLGKRVTEAFPGVDAFGIFEVFQRVWRTGLPEDFPENVYKDARDLGSWRDNRVFKLPTGEIVAVYNDITRRKGGIEKLRLAHDRLALAQRAAGAGLWDWDMTTQRLEWSPELFRLFGLDPDRDEANFDTWERILHPEDREEAGSRLRAAIRDHARLENEYRIVLPSGEARWISALGDTAYDAQGRPLRMAGICLDITAHKRSEILLQESRARYASVFESTGTATLLVDEDTTIVMANGECLSATGYRPDELIGTKWPGYVAPESLELMLKYHNLRREESGAAPIKYEVRLINKKGQTRHVVIAIAMIPGTKQSVVSMLDITERKRAEEAVQASLREKDILLREIHHRVKNNMQIISSLFNLQAGHIQDESARRMLKDGQMRIRSMALVHEKLYQSRDLSKIDFADYLRSLSDHLFQLFRAEAGRIRLELRLEPVHLSVNAAVPCGLLINELVSNSLTHAFPEGREGTVTIELHRRGAEIVELRVADDGVGLPDGLDFRSTESLGLQIVTLLVDQLDGTIDLERGKGAAFTIAFPEPGTGPATGA